MAELEWELAEGLDNIEGMYDMARWATYFLCTFCHSLRGWETMKALITQLLCSQIVDEGEANLRRIPAHFGLPLYGRFLRVAEIQTRNSCV